MIHKFTLISFSLATVFTATTWSAPKDELKIAVNAEFDTIHPLVNTMAAGGLIQDAIMRPLVMITPQGKPKAVLIKEIPTIENKKARLFTDKTGKHLKADVEFIDNAMWGDGKPVTCKDLHAGWKVGSNDLVATPNRDDYDNVQDIVIDNANPKKCSIIFKRPQYNYYVSFPRLLPAHLELPIFEKHKGHVLAYERNSLYSSKITEPGLYNGPYRVSELKQGSHVVLVPNEKFYGTKPYFKKVIFKFILNSTSMEANLMSGNVDMTSSSGMSFDQTLAFEKKVKAQNLPYEVKYVAGSMYAHIELNLDNSILKDLKVRQALLLGFNRSEMGKSFFDGKQPPAIHFSTPLDEWFTDDPKLVTIYPYSKMKAQRMLDEAGWKMGPDGYRYKDGKKMSLTMTNVADNKMNEMIAVYLQGQWKQLGLEVILKSFPGRVFFGEILRQRKFEMAALTWVESPNMVPQGTMSSEMVPSKGNGWSGHNRSGWKNKEVDKLLVQAGEEFDQKKRIEIMHKILKIYTEELPQLPSYYRSNTSIIPKGLKGYEMSGHNNSEYLQIENWHF
ncbi:peptide ABC transporter substrate-binding protein [Bdellovibrio sp. SKB1291214]|uniref:peptide ABC transporter substrate-binding protein n=1 Tax=Bdellovibrio sp. SKB1291214 TaxID=1732569 RepID=UPI0015954306|nr:peptide ABC transporter substrate-binding protein [Bdellovibrio sp. SKB1291214]UYL07477.1 peptide ABC transporter substrate-binding protein [Bdellovibrio sp. SKB1291214]